MQCLIPVSVSERCCFPSECRVCDAFYRPCIGMSDLVVRPMFSRCYIFSRAFDGAAWPVSSPGWCTDSQLESMFSWRGVGLFVVLYRSVVESNFGRYCQRRCQHVPESTWVVDWFTAQPGPVDSARRHLPISLSILIIWCRQGTCRRLQL